MIKVILDSEEIKYFIISATDGRIIESGETLNNDTWEDTFIRVDTIEVGKTPKISFNYGFYTRSCSKKEPVWVNLAYKVTDVQKTKKDKDVQGDK